MTANARDQGAVPDPVTTLTESELLQEVHRRLVRIHSAIVERTNDDKEIIPWTEYELWTLVQQLGAFRREQRELATKA
jgi:hypothetical protein